MLMTNLRSKSLILSLILSAVLVFLSGFQSFNIPIYLSQGTLKLDQFDLVTESDGWIRMGQRIFWTRNAGQAWFELTPPLSSADSILDVFFLDTSSGWILSRAMHGIEPHFSLMHTNDGGDTWDVLAISLFEPGEIAAYTETAELGWLDSQTGWITIRQSGGINFSVGTLFTTTDAGKSWKRHFLPLAENVVFSNPQKGWASGGPDGKQIQRTLDGGQTWEDIRPQDAPVNARFHPPSFTGNQGLLLGTNVKTGHVLVYRTQDFGTSWEESQTFDLGIRSDVIGLSSLNGESLDVLFPGSSHILNVNADKAFLTENVDGQAESIIQLDMATALIGWGKWSVGDCGTGNTCTSETRLLRTHNGGKSWNTITLPVFESESITNSYEIKRAETLVRTNGAVTEIAPTLIGQGFDACELPTTEELGSWKVVSPFDAVNLYIGGSSRACPNTSLNANHIVELNQQGWMFIPTWVGPQAPCSVYSSKMSPDPATAFKQGVAEARAAVNTLHTLGLTYPDKSGSVVYYDIEYYGFDTDCRAAVKAFMNGWVSRLHALGNIAGVYSSTICDTGLSDFRDINHVPDVIWPARWFHNAGEGSYDPDATVWDLGSCVPNTVWENHQRIRQYEGAHDETWGDVTLNIDNNVLDGVVAVPFTNPLVLSVNRADASPSSTLGVDFIVTFSEPVIGVDSTDFSLTVSGLTGTAIIRVEDAGDQTRYRVTVDSGLGNGTIRLDVNNSGTGIIDVDGKPLYGGYSTGGEYTINKRLQAYSQPRFDGWMLESGEFSGKGGTKNKLGKFLRVGDDSSDKQFRSILSFDTAAIPDNAVITNVILQVKKAGVIGTNPMDTHNRLVVDISKGIFYTLPALQVNDFQAKPGKYRVGKFPKKLYSGWHKADLHTGALPYINKTGHTQLRLRFTLDDNDDNGADILRLYSGNADQANRPQLIIDYYTPGYVPLPPKKAEWQIQYSGMIDLSLDVNVYNLDLFDTSAAAITKLHSRGIYVMCYFSAGSWENWRPDAGQYPPEILGNDYNGWNGEKWLDIRAIDTLTPLLVARMDQAVDKGCDGIDPDNVDGYQNNTGFPLTYAHQLAFNVWLSQEAHKRGLAIGLKNDLNQIPDLLPHFDWGLNEECFTYNECDLLAPFLEVGKPVFVIEYDTLPIEFCPGATVMGINALYKNWDLDAFRESCP